MATAVDSESLPEAATPANHPRRRRWLLATAATAVVVAAAAVGAAVGGSDDEQSAPKTGKTVTLALPGGGVAAGSCIRFDESVLAQMPLAFGGTVTSLDDSSVVLDVDRWYRPGPEGAAPTVRLRVSETGMPAIIDGVEFAKEKRYLVAATDGTANGCGYSGPATAELEAAYGRAFA